MIYSFLNSRFRLVSVALGLIIAFYGCKSQKDIAKSQERSLTDVLPTKELTDDEILVSQVHSLSPVFSTYSAKIDVEYDGMSYNGTLRMVKDSVIWISMGKFGFEGARVMLTKDSVFFLNKINREYFSGNYNFLYGILGLKVNYDIVQSLLLGKDFSDFDTAGFLIEPLSDVVKVTFNSRTNLKNPNDFAKLNQQLFYNRKLKQINRNYVEILNSKNKLDVYYSSYLPLGGYNFPKNINVIVFTGKTMRAIINYEKQRLNERLNFPFSIPKSYDSIK